MKSSVSRTLGGSLALATIVGACAVMSCGGGASGRGAGPRPPGEPRPSTIPEASDAADGVWRSLPPLTGSLAEKLARDPRRVATSWKDGRLFVFFASATSARDRHAPHEGATLDVASETWTPFTWSRDRDPNPMTPSDEPRLDTCGAAGELEFDRCDVPRIRSRGVELQLPFGGTIAGARLVVGGHVSDPGVPPADAFALPAAGAPSPRGGFVFARMGDAIAIWGGVTTAGPVADGAIFDLRARTWRAMSPSGAPAPARGTRTSAWTGRYLVVYGPGRDGARYDPQKNQWSNIAAGGPEHESTALAIWTGARLLLITRAGAAASYDPARDAWGASMALGDLGPPGRIKAWAVDRGRVLLVREAPERGGDLWMRLLDPDASRVLRIPAPPLQANAAQAIHSDGARLIVWGGMKYSRVSPGGGGCEHVPPNQGCDPVGPSYEGQLRLDGASYVLPR